MVGASSGTVSPGGGSGGRGVTNVDMLAGTGDDNFSTIGGNIITSVAALPGLLSGLAYLLGILLGAVGILKIKEHVEDPRTVALKDGLIRVLSGGGLFALPIIYEAMFDTIGSNGATVTTAQLSPIAMR